MKKVIITGSAGFIGFHTALRFLKEGFEVQGIDNLNDYYDVSLKNYRLKQLEVSSLNKSSWHFYKISIEDYKSLLKVFKEHKPHIVINLAAQAGVRYSLVDPNSYIQSNLVGFANIMDLVKSFSIENFIYASSSSVYGLSLIHI